MKMNKIQAVKTALSEETPGKYGIVSVAVLVLVILCELFVFNFKWINSAFDKPVAASLSLQGISQTQSGNLNINSDSAKIIIRNIDQKIKYFYFKPGDDKENKADIVISATDEANSNPLYAPQRTVLTAVKRSQYIRLHFSGEIGTLALEIKGMSGKKINRNDIQLNAHVPLMFSFWRVLILTLLLIAAYALRPKSILYRYKTNLRNTEQKIIAGALVVIQASMLLAMLQWNLVVISIADHGEHQMQYHQLVDSFKERRLDITDNDVSQELKKLENPYDLGARAGVTYKWDHAYYNGKYYVYFGVVPALTMYLPYNFITGKHLPNYVAVYILCILMMIGIMLLLWEVIKKWFKNTPFVIYLMISVVFGAVSGIGYIIYKPDFYSVPILEGIVMGLFGFSFWLSSKKETVEKSTGKTSITIVPWRLVVGSACIALIAGCRPQMLLVIAFGVMLFWDDVFKERALLSKSSIKQTLALCIPFAVVAAGIMWYNFARFGSPFDFGANYNLTSNDMTHRGFVWGRTGLGLFSYLFQPLNIDAVFPFLHDFKAHTTYQGLTLTENMLGGVFLLFPILLFGAYGTFRRKMFDNKKTYKIVYFSMIMVAVLVVLDTQMAGLLTRYFMDFVWIGMIASSVTVFACCETYKNEQYKYDRLIKTVALLSALSLILVFLRVFAHSEDAIVSSNPQLYYTMQHLIAFWM